MGIPKIIAIDGPAASGKSTLGKRLAETLNYLYFDTGVMYRAVTLAALQRGVNINDEAAITTLAETVDIDVLPPSKNDGRGYDIFVGGKDVTWEIRRPEVDTNVSVVSAYPAVRRALSIQQRKIGLRGKVVMVGRDIGTIVLPEADLKIYLDASVEERANRRFNELVTYGQKAVYSDILASMRQRDFIDSNRQVAPLRPANDAVILTSDSLNIEQVFERVRELVYKNNKSEI